jgi:hypothetical protein
MSFRVRVLLGGLFALVLSGSLIADDDYVHVQEDLDKRMELQEISDRAYANAEEYWAYIHGHERDEHDHPEHEEGQPDYNDHDGIDEELSAGEAVMAIYNHATANRDNVDQLALDIVEVTTAVVDSWPDC